MIDRKPSRVLIRLPNWLGDVLLARPLLHALRRMLPDAALFGVAPAPLLALLEPENLLAETAPWPAHAAGRRACLTRARAFSADAALVLPPSFSSAWFAWRSGARERVGYAGEARSMLLTRAVQRGARGDRHLAEEYLALAGLGEEGLAEIPDLPVSPAGKAAAERLLVDAGLAGQRLAILGPGAIYGPAKRWSAERFVALGRGLAARGHAIAVCGTAAERGTCDGVADGIGAAARSFAGATDLPTVAALCARASLAVCNDSGLAHLAAAVGAPTVALFGSTCSAWTAPLGRSVRVVQSPPVCAPCFRRTCRIGYACLERIEVEQVEAASLGVTA